MAQPFPADQPLSVPEVEDALDSIAAFAADFGWDPALREDAELMLDVRREVQARELLATVEWPAELVAQLA